MCRHTVLQLTLTYLAPSAALSSMKSSPCMPVHACMLAAAQVPACVHRSTQAERRMVPPDLSHKGLKLVEVRFQFQSMVWLQNSRQSLHVLHTQLEHVFTVNIIRICARHFTEKRIIILNSKMVWHLVEARLVMFYVQIQIDGRII